MISLYTDLDHRRTSNEIDLFSEHLPTPFSSRVFPLDSTDALDSDGLHDSVNKRRRHAVYFHRPPLWSSEQSTTSSCSAVDRCRTCCLPINECICSIPGSGYIDSLNLQGQNCLSSWALSCDPWFRPTEATETTQPCLETDVSDAHQRIPLLVSSLLFLLLLSSILTISIQDDWEGCDSRWYSTSSSDMGDWPSIHRHPSDLFPRLFRQVKPALCTRLQSYRDVRSSAEERWAVQEGSLVISLDPSFTACEHDQQPDEFQLASGDLYIVCRLYADLWALCYKIPPTSDWEPTESPRLGFLPICAVTLAANFGPFVRRCHTATRSLQIPESRHPGNGLRVMPPPRSHSLNASRQIFQGYNTKIALPGAVREALGSSALDHNTDFIPLDSTLEQIFSKFDRGCRLRNLGTGISMRMSRNSAISSRLRSYHNRINVAHQLRVGWSNAKGTDHGRHHYTRRERGGKSSTSEKLKSLFRKSQGSKSDSQM